MSSNSFQTCSKIVFSVLTEGYTNKKNVIAKSNTKNFKNAKIMPICPTLIHPACVSF